MVAKAEASMPQTDSSVGVSAFTSFNISGLSTLHTLVVPLLIVFTIANALAPYFVDGGSWYKVFFNLGILSAISGIAMICLPQLAAMLFSSVKM